MLDVHLTFGNGMRYCLFYYIGKCSYSSGTHSKALALHFFIKKFVLQQDAKTVCYHALSRRIDSGLIGWLIENGYA